MLFRSMSDDPDYQKLKESRTRVKVSDSGLKVSPDRAFADKNIREKSDVAVMGKYTTAVIASRSVEKSEVRNLS